jgi:hypothetical protein
VDLALYPEHHRAVKRIDLTPASLGHPLELQTGQAYQLVIPFRVVLELSVDEAVLSRLPADAAFHLDGSGAVRQTRTLASAAREGGWVTLRFGWMDEDRPTTLTVSANGQSITIWTDRNVVEDPPHAGEPDLTPLLQPEQEPDWLALSGDEPPILLATTDVDLGPEVQGEVWA